MKRKEFLIPSDLPQVQKSSAEVLGFLRPLALSEAQEFDIRLCLEEALINAMKYGNCFQKELNVRVVAEYDDAEIRFAIEDQGPGFDPKRVENCTEEKNLLKNGGRGVYLIHQLMDRVRYNEKGNRLEMSKRYTRSAENRKDKGGNMNVKSYEQDGVRVFEVQGEINISTSPDLKKQFEKDAAKVVAVDLSGVHYIDSSGLATLVEMLKRLRGQGGKLGLAGLSNKVRSLFEITKLDKLFQVFPDKTEAVARLK